MPVHVFHQFEVKHARLYPFQARFQPILDDFCPFWLQSGPVPANFRPVKWPEPKLFIDNNMLDT